MSKKENLEPPRGPKLDPVQKKYIDDWNLIYCCEQCTHFDAKVEACLFGFPTAPHLQRNQLIEFEKSGTMALCRLQEID